MFDHPGTTAHGLVQLDELYYAGSHGFDIAGPQRQVQVGADGGGGDGGDPDPPDGDNMAISYMAADSYRPALEAAKQQAEEMLGDVKGVVVEDNTFSVSVHYRMVAEGEDRVVKGAPCRGHIRPHQATTGSSGCI